MVHPSKKDRWLVVLLGFFSAALLVGGGTLVGIAVVHPVYALLFPGGMLLAIGFLILWFLTNTTYEITETNLIIRSGPVRWRVPLDAIEEVVPTEMKWQLGPEWGFALALKGLRIRYRTQGGRLTWPIRIAPRDRAAFLLELTERQPGLLVKDDGSLHRPTNTDVTG
jgi:hypothetical protein